MILEAWGEPRWPVGTTRTHWQTKPNRVVAVEAQPLRPVVRHRVCLAASPQAGLVKSVCQERSRCRPAGSEQHEKGGPQITQGGHTHLNENPTMGVGPSPLICRCVRTHERRKEGGEQPKAVHLHCHAEHPATLINYKKEKMRT